MQISKYNPWPITPDFSPKDSRMTAVAGLKPQPLPTGSVPGAIPGTQEPEIWKNQTITAVEFHGKVNGTSVQELKPNYPLSRPSKDSEHLLTTLFTPVGSTFDEAVRSAAKLSHAAAGPINLKPYTDGEVPVSQTIAVLQAKDGAFFATGLTFSEGRPGHSVIPATGVNIKGTDGNPLTFDFTKKIDNLKALVWADQWVNFTDAKIGEVASVRS